MFRRHRRAAVPETLSLLAGGALGGSSFSSSPGALLALIALGLALGRRTGSSLAFLGLGMVLSSGARPLSWTLDLERPVTVHARLDGEWRVSRYGSKTRASGRWLRQGTRVGRWEEDLVVVIPTGLRTPKQHNLRLTGYLRRPATTANGIKQRATNWQLRVKSAAFLEISAEGEKDFLGPLTVLSQQLRERIEQHLATSDPERWPRRSYLVQSLALGRSDALPDEILRSLRASGLTHLFALSGLHVGLLVGIVFQLTIGAQTKVRLCSVVIVVLLYALVAGGRPSLIRATVMMFAVLGAWSLCRPPQSLNTLAWVAAAMFITEPGLISNIGFQLTFSATAGILLIAPRLAARWYRVPGWLRIPMSVSIGAHIAVLPWALSLFHLVTPLTPILTLLAVPWTALTLCIALLWTLAALCAPVMTVALDPVLDGLALPLEGLSSMPAEWLLTIPSSLGWWPALALSAAIAIIVLLPGWRRSLALAAVLWLSMNGDRPPGDPEVVVLDVGQGEAILVRDGSRALLIDGGGWQRSDIAQRVLVPALAKLGLERLSGIVLTHPDQDHCAGLLGLTSYLPIDRLYVSPGWAESQCLTDLLTRSGLEVRSMWKGEQIDLGRWKLLALHPRAGDRLGRNNRSLVFLATVGEKTVLLTGDLEAGGEDEVLELAELSNVDVLKVGHHGSATSTSDRWLERLQPRLALISCGRGNRYGHPSTKVLERLGGNGIRILRSDRDGGVRIVFPPGGHMRIEFLAKP